MKAIVLLSLLVIVNGQVTRTYDFSIARSVQYIAGRTLVVNTVNNDPRGHVIRVNKGDTLSVLVRNNLTDFGLLYITRV